MVLPSAPGATGAAGDMVVLHAMRSSNGPLNSIEVVTSTNSAFNAPATKYLSTLGENFLSDANEPGTTLRTSEVLFTLHYVNSPNNESAQ
jgi:hypothetical protein